MLNERSQTQNKASCCNGHLYETSRIDKSIEIETESRLWLPGLVGGEMGIDCLMGMECHFGG